jgi:hypothetical protein
MNYIRSLIRCFAALSIVGILKVAALVFILGLFVLPYVHPCTDILMRRVVCEENQLIIDQAVQRWNREHPVSIMRPFPEELFGPHATYPRMPECPGGSLYKYGYGQPTRCTNPYHNPIPAIGNTEENTDNTQ